MNSAWGFSPASKRRESLSSTSSQRGSAQSFSKRRAAIVSHLHELGLSGARSAAIATLDTRSTKQDIDRATFFARWQETGAAHGVTAESIRSAIQIAPRRDVERLTTEAIDKAKARATEQTSHFSQRELVRYMAEELEACGIGADKIREAVKAEVESSPDVVRVGEVEGDTRYTTREMLELELSLLAHAERLAANDHAVDDASFTRSVSSRETILDEQREAVESLTQGSSLALPSRYGGYGEDLHAGSSKGKHGKRLATRSGEPPSLQMPHEISKSPQG